MEQEEQTVEVRISNHNKSRLRTRFRSKAEEEAIQRNNNLRRLLAQRSVHLPNHGWCADWIQFMRNNHPLLGICCKYRQNPIGVMQRITMLVGSIALGVAITNSVYLYFRFYRGVEDEILIEVKLGGHGGNELGDYGYGDSDGGGGVIFEVSSETVVLWTLGSVVHSLVDYTVWHLAACACCMPGAWCSCCGCFRTLGRYLTICLCAIFVALATSAIIIRENFDEASAQGNVVNATVDELTEIKMETLDSAFSFLVEYCGELVVVYFITFPIVATVFFMGLIPCTGGRPSEMKRQRDEEERRCKNCDTDYDDEDDENFLYYER